MLCFCVIDAGCQGYEWKCASGQCVYHDLYCNGYPECDDESDEPPGCRK